MWKLSQVTFLGLLFPSVVIAFTPIHHHRLPSTRSTSSIAIPLFAQTTDDDANEETAPSAAWTRRDLLSQTFAATAAAATMAFSSKTPNAWAEENAEAIATAPATTTQTQSVAIGSSPEHPIVVLGAGGKVGKLCTQLLADKGLYVRATTRSGRSILDQASPFVSYTPADVTSYDSLQQAIQGASGVIFAASASGKKKGGEPAKVDYLGTYYTAKACLQENVPKLVVVSAGTVTRPDSLGFKATNAFVKFLYGDRIMDAKMAGEAAMRDLYAEAAAGSAGSSSKPTYTVVRPGGLNDKGSAGPAALHVSQGDVYSSEISRTDVALVTVAALLKGSATDNVTFELNQVEGLSKAQGTLPDLPPALIHAGAPTFDALLDNLLTDAQIQQQYPTIVNSQFRGDGMPPLSQLTTV